MKVEELAKWDIPQIIIERFKKEGISQLNEPQIKAIEQGLFDGKNIVVSAPTSSGKTVVMSLAVLNNTIKRGGKAIYLAPLKALASEMYKKHLKLFEGTNIRTAISTGDFDSSDRWIVNYDFIILTPEKLDSLLRHNAPWVREITTVIVDEIHTLDQPDRGPVLEVIITRIKKYCPNAQIVGLSATIKNGGEVAEWLKAELVKSEYRPVKLAKGIFLNGEIDYRERVEKVESSKNEDEIKLVEDTLKKGKQALLFLNSRRNAEGSAKKCAKAVQKTLTPEEKEKLLKLSEEALNALDSPTKQCEILSECLKGGVAFHHAGLISKQRDIIEDSFRERLIKVICATPTMAMGCNTPAHTVIVRDLKRYSENGMNWIPVLDVHQMIGRSGRPQYDNEGRGILLAKSEDEKIKLFEKFIDGEPEEIYSKLSVEPVLRMQILGLIASGEINSKSSLFEFFSETFFAHQFKNIEKLNMTVFKIVESLKGWGFINAEGEMLSPTGVGKRVSELYLDPFSAHKMINYLKRKDAKEIYYLHMICMCLEMWPLLNFNQKDYETLKEKSIFYQGSIVEEPSFWDGDYERWLRAFKTSLLFEEWIDEVGEARLMENFGETPGALHSKLKIGDWLLYSASEIANLMGLKESLLPLRKLRIRVQYGAREELLRLLKFEGIGRKRARKLYNSNIRTVSDIKKAGAIVLGKVVGEKTAEKIMKQVSEEKEKQSNLESFNLNEDLLSDK